MLLPRLLLRTALSSTLHKYKTSTINYSITNLAKMGDATKKGLPLKTLLTHLEEFASSKSAESWDNTGLLIDPMDSKPINKILFTNDLTEDVMQEAIDLKVGMILSYHPPIFKGLKQITANHWKERIVIQCLKHQIALYSPHTSWDNKPDGPNKWITECLEPESSEPILESGTGLLSKLKKPLAIRVAVEKIKAHIKMPHLRLALAVGKNLESEISSVAVCVGSGSSVLNGVKADLYLTGEMLHHDILEAAHNGSHVILCNHSDSERGYLRSVVPIFQNKIFNGEVEVIMSEKDADPLKTV